jgi:hypothetical protein
MTGMPSLPKSISCSCFGESLDVFVDELECRNRLDLRPYRLMQLQRYVGILGRIFGGTIHVNLIERDFLRALAGELLEVDRLDTEVSHGARIHVVARRDAVQNVGFQHGIEALAIERDAVVGQHMRVELKMMAELGLGHILEHRLQCRQRLVAIELVRRAGIVVSERYVRSFAGRNRERHSDDLRAHIVQAVGLGVERNERRSGKFLEPHLQFLFRHDLVVVARLRRADHGDRRRNWRAARVARLCDHYVHLGRARRRRRRRRRSQ